MSSRLSSARLASQVKALKEGKSFDTLTESEHITEERVVEMMRTRFAFARVKKLVRKWREDVIHHRRKSKSGIQDGYYEHANS